MHGLKLVMTLETHRAHGAGGEARRDCRVCLRVARRARQHHCDSRGGVWRRLAATPRERHAVLIGARYPLVGRVSMDMIAVDVTGGAKVATGNKAIIWGPGLPVEEVGAARGHDYLRTVLREPTVL